MVQFNPFDDSFLKHRIGSTENISAPNKVDEASMPSDDKQGMQSGTIEKTDENDYLDMSDMVDDSAEFDSSSFENEDNEQINKADKNSGSSDNQENNQEDKEEIMEDAMQNMQQFMDNFFDKKN